MIVLRQNMHVIGAHASETITQGTDILKLEARVLECKTRRNGKEKLFSLIIK